MSIHSVITQVLATDPTGDPKTLAVRVLALASQDDLVDLIASEVATSQRATARREERQAFAAMFESASPAPRAPMPENLRSLFANTFHLGDGSQVPWLTATIEQHQQRIEHLTRIRDGLDRTIDQHREAVRMIAEAGVTCLADLTEVRSKVA